MEHDARVSCFARVPKKLFVIRPSRKGNKLKAREDIYDYASGKWFSVIQFCLFQPMKLRRKRKVLAFSIDFSQEKLYISNVRYEQQKIGLAHKCAINKKSAIFIQSSWYSNKITYPWASYFAKISAWLEENCRFFSISTFLSQSYFLLLIL